MNSDPAYSQNSSAADSIEPGKIGQLGDWLSLLKRQPAWAQYGLLGAAGLLVLLGSVGGYQALIGSHEALPVSESRVLPVETIAVEKVSSYRVPRIYTGEIASIRTSNLGFERGGELVQVMVEEGERVTAGEPLAKLDIQNLETQRLQVEAQKAQAEARLAELQNGARAENIAVAEAAVRDLEKQLTLQETQEQRREYLYARGAIAREQLDEFAFGADSLQAKLDQARSRLQELLNGTRFEQVDAQSAVVNQLQAQLQDIDVNIAKSTITAPFDGIVAKRRVDEGTVVGTGQSVVELVEAAVPEARIGVPAEVVNQLKVGSTHAVSVNNQSYQAEVDAILPEVDASTRTQTVVLKLDSTALGEIEPGQTARLTTDETIQADGYWLPTEALTQGIRGLWTCYVLVPEGRFRDSEEEDNTSFVETPEEEEDAVGASNGTMVVEPRSIEIIQQESASTADGSQTRALVRGTLKPGEQVAISGIHRLVTGQPVRAISAN